MKVDFSLIRESLLDKDFLLDTNVLNNFHLLRNDRLETEFWRSLTELSTIRIHESYSITSVHLALECLGVRRESLDPFRIDEKLKNQITEKFRQCRTENIPTILNQIVRKIETWYETSGAIDLNDLRRKFDYQQKLRSTHGKLLYEQLINTALKDDHFLKQSSSQLAMNGIQYFDYSEMGIPADTVRNIDNYFMSNYRKICIDGIRGFAPTRHADRFLVRAVRAKTKINLAKAYSDLGETLDCEIVHLLCMGNNERGLREVAVFTAEKLEKWYPRLHRHIAFLGYLLEESEVMIAPGTIFEVDIKSGKISRRLSVNEIFGNHLREIGVKIKSDMQFIM